MSKNIIPNRRKLAIRKIFKNDDKTRDKYLHVISDSMDILFT